MLCPGGCHRTDAAGGRRKSQVVGRREPPRPGPRRSHEDGSPQWQGHQYRDPAKGPPPRWPWRGHSRGRWTCGTGGSAPPADHQDPQGAPQDPVSLAWWGVVLSLLWILRLSAVDDGFFCRGGGVRRHEHLCRVFLRRAGQYSRVLRGRADYRLARAEEDTDYLDGPHRIFPLCHSDCQVVAGERRADLLVRFCSGVGGGVVCARCTVDRTISDNDPLDGARNAHCGGTHLGHPGHDDLRAPERKGLLAPHSTHRAGLHGRGVLLQATPRYQTLRRVVKQSVTRTGRETHRPVWTLSCLLHGYSLRHARDGPRDGCDAGSSEKRPPNNVEMILRNTYP
mmetsp:Transcript_3141/g.7575  ORF Transcript_3141/g.7575 Transcript_3141/m.7575 type:complete len:338 (+) Transcript_3141:912-1925(+)